MREKILFLVHTEYHMLVTMSIISDIYFAEDKYQIWIVQTIGERSNRFKFVKDLSAFNHIAYQELIYDESLIEHNPHFVSFIALLNASQIATVVIFNRLTFVAFFVSKTLYKKGTKIVLAPDGAAAYVKVSGFTPRWSFLLSINTHRYLWKNNFKQLYFYWPTLVYGRLKEIMELWVQYPDFVYNKANKPVREIHVLISKKSIDFSKEYFGYKSNRFPRNCILYANQPFRDNRINEFELDILRMVLKQHSDRCLIIKLHPTTFELQSRRLKEIESAIVLETTIPAELIIADLKDSLVISFWSTSMLVNNESCRFFWLYPMLEIAGIRLGKFTITNPGEHIQLVHTLDQIQ